MDIYSKYGLTKELAIAKGIRPLEYVRIESLEFAEEVSQIPLQLSALIKKQELVWTLSIEATYEQRRRWSEFLAFRELLQNSLDAEHEAVGYDGITVKLEEDRKLGTWIKDRGGGIIYKAFILGGEQKPCEMRGAYGEGLKLALIWFTTRGYPVYFFTRGSIVFSCYYSKIADALVIVFGESVPDTKGTHALISDYFMPSDMYQKMYYRAAELSPICKYPYGTGNCPKPMPNLVLSPGGSLYVRDIYVNEIKTLIGKTPYFSYNLWWVELEPNRVAVTSAWNLSREIAHLLGACPRITAMIDASLSAKEYGGIKYYELGTDYYESKVEYSVVAQPVAEAVRALLNKYRITAYSCYGDLDGVGAVSHEGGVCLLAPEEIFPLFQLLPRASEFVIKSLREMVEGAIPLDERTINAYERGRLQIWKLWRDAICPDVKIELIKGDRSFHRSDLNTIFMCKFDVEYHADSQFIHELSHAYGCKHYKEAPDITENLERALAKVGQEIFEFIIPLPEYRAVRRCHYGCINAIPKTEDMFFAEVLKPRLDDATRSRLLIDPMMFVIIADSAVYTSSSVLAYNPPVEETYDKLAKERLKALITIRDRYLRFEISIGEAGRELEAANLSRELVKAFDALQLEIYIYDIRLDKYSWYERVVK